MAKITRVELVDDLDGTTLSEQDGETIDFSIDGTAYVIDLSKENAEKLRKDFSKYTAVATKKSAPRGVGASRGAGTRRSSGSGRSSEELNEIRNWANANGYDVASRGRVKAEIVEAFDAAHK